jgi:hypothetical protein
MRRKKEKWVDDGRTIAPMTGEEIPQSGRAFFSGRERKRNLKNKGKSDVTRKEQHAMMRALFAVMLPRILVVLACFSLVALLMWLWLS